MNRKTAKLIRAFAKITNKSYRGMKKAFEKLSDADRTKSKKELKKFYEDNLKQGIITKDYRDLKRPLHESLKDKKDSVEKE